MDSFFSVRQSHGHTVVDFQTESLMNPRDVEQVGQGLYRLVDEQNARQVLLDFTRVKYLSSQAIGIILTLNKKLSQFKGATLTLCGVGQTLLQLLKITRLDKILKVVPTQAEALKAK